MVLTLSLHGLGSRVTGRGRSLPRKKYTFTPRVDYDTIWVTKSRPVAPVTVTPTRVPFSKDQRNSHIHTNIVPWVLPCRLGPDSTRLREPLGSMGIPCSLPSPNPIPTDSGLLPALRHSPSVPKPVRLTCMSLLFSF